MQIVSCLSAKVAVTRFMIFDDIWILIGKFWNRIVFLANTNHFLIINSRQSYKANMMIGPSYVVQGFLQSFSVSHIEQMKTQEIHDNKSTFWSSVSECLHQLVQCLFIFSFKGTRWWSTVHSFPLDRNLHHTCIELRGDIFLSYYRIYY